MASRMTKLFAGRGFIWGCAGPVDVAQAFTLGVLADKGLRPQLGRVACSARLKELLVAAIASAGTTEPVEILVGWVRADNRFLLKMLSTGRLEWAEKEHKIGYERAQILAHFDLVVTRFADPRELTVEQARVLGFKVVSDVIEARVPGVGFEVQLATVTSEGTAVLDASEVQAVGDEATIWTSACRAALGAPGTSPSESVSPDRGIRAPARPPD
jgi:hypothetical protein